LLSPIIITITVPLKKVVANVQTELPALCQAPKNLPPILELRTTPVTPDMHMRQRDFIANARRGTVASTPLVLTDALLNNMLDHLVRMIQVWAQEHF
jgi:hypothetical protein